MTFAPRLRPTLFNHKAMERQVHVPQIEGAASVFSMPLSRLRYNYLDGVFHCLLSRGFVGGVRPGAEKFRGGEGARSKSQFWKGAGRRSGFFVSALSARGRGGSAVPGGTRPEAGIEIGFDLKERIEMLLGLLVGAIVFFALCYKIYGGFMSRVYELNDSNKTPAETMYDGVDYCPAHPAVLLGHHFSSIAGAGPIVSPITAAGMFGWLPAYLWCVIGSAFLGGPHDMGGLVSEQVFSSYFSEVLKGFLPTIPDFLLSFVL